MSFVILTENTTDLTLDYIKGNEIAVLPLVFSLDGKEYDGSLENSPSSREFYDALRNGKSAITTQASPDVIYNLYKKLLESYDGVLHLCFSSGLSGTFQSSLIALNELKEENHSANVCCVDSLCASLGHGLLVDYAVKLRKSGTPLEETAKAVEDIKLKLCHYFTVDDLNHLYRGGRVSKAAAIFGTMLGIKPVLHVDEEGHLIAIGKVRGRKASLEALVEKMGAKIGDYKNPYVFISHGDCVADAEYVGELVKKKYGIKAEMINDIGPVIGAHSGPGTVALFFFGTDRAEKKL